METSFPLAALRVRAGLTLKDAAPAFGVTRWTLAKYEADSSRMPARLIDVAEHLYLVPRSLIFIGDAGQLAADIRTSGEPPGAA